MNQITITKTLEKVKERSDKLKEVQSHLEQKTRELE